MSAPIYVIQTETKHNGYFYDVPIYTHEAVLSMFDYAGQFHAHEIDRIPITNDIVKDSKFYNNLCFTGNYEKYKDMREQLIKIFMQRVPYMKREYIQ